MPFYFAGIKEYDWWDGYETNPSTYVIDADTRDEALEKSLELLLEPECFDGKIMYSDVSSSDEDNKVSLHLYLDGEVVGKAECIKLQNGDRVIDFKGYKNVYYRYTDYSDEYGAYLRRESTSR